MINDLELCRIRARRVLANYFAGSHNAEPLDSGRVACSLNNTRGNADARIIALRDEPREQVEVAIRGADGAGFVTPPG